MIKVLVIEDDINIAKMILTTLDIGGYHGESCHNGNEALKRMNTESWDLILLDVMLPDKDGFTIMKERQSTETPVIFLTAKQDVVDKVQGLRLGAEDYMVKPFEAVELLARIEVVLRRVHRSSHLFEYKNITINVEEHSVHMDKKEVALTPREFELLTFFIQHCDIALTRERLLAAVWGYDYEGETRTVDIHVQQLRKKLNLKEHLVTISKLGYRLNS